MGIIGSVWQTHGKRLETFWASLDTPWKVLKDRGNIRKVWGGLWKSLDALGRYLKQLKASKAPWKDLGRYWKVLEAPRKPLEGFGQVLEVPWKVPGWSWKVLEPPRKPLEGLGLVLEVPRKSWDGHGMS